MTNLAGISAELDDARSLYRSGAFAEAEQLCQRIVDKKSDALEALYLLAGIQLRSGKGELALKNYDRVLVLRPNHASTLCNRGFALHLLKRLEEALDAYERALAVRPDDHEILLNRGNTLRELNRFEEALTCYRRALTLRSDFTQALINYGNTLYDLGRPEDALESYGRADKLQPNNPEILFNRGTVLTELNRLDEAMVDFSTAISLKPDFTEAHFNLASLQLVTGDFTPGWLHYEWRWRDDSTFGPARAFSRPRWVGNDSLIDKTVLLHNEQGLGDTIQFCRYVALVAARGARVIVEVDECLRRLLTTLPGAAEVVAKGDILPHFDLQCPLLSLPLAFDTRLETIPCQTPYLFPPASRSSEWRDRLGKHDKPRVGLVWAGNPNNNFQGAKRIDVQRSIAFDQLASLFEVEYCEFYSLQKGNAARNQLHAHPLRDRVTDWTDDLDDFLETAALVENLDLVISVDTSVAHLTGAIGKPFWLLNRHNTCWRWLLEREDSPWYPTARLFRQDAGRDWNVVITRVRSALEDFCAKFNWQEGQ